MAGDLVNAAEPIIFLNVHDAREGTFINYKLKRRSMLRRVMKEYIQRNDLTRTTVRFRYHSNIISETDTPLSLGMEDGDDIYVYYSPVPPVILHQQVEE